MLLSPLSTYIRSSLGEESCRISGVICLGLTLSADPVARMYSLKGLNDTQFTFMEEGVGKMEEREGEERGEGGGKGERGRGREKVEVTGLTEKVRNCSVGWHDRRE